MIFMADCSCDLEAIEGELDAPVEQLFSPTTNRNPKRNAGGFGIDNGAFSAFSAGAFEGILAKHAARIDRCRFVAAPDVVGSARRTLEVFEHWYPRLVAWPVALVAQDGQEDLPIPWDLITALFIGGSTEWKMSGHAAACIRAAQAIGKWVHVGRVNTPGRWDYFESIGADSCDGTGLSRYSHMRAAIRQPTLFEEAHP